MGLDGDFAFISTSMKVFLIDLFLSGDNAVVIALACRSLPAPQMRKVMLLGAGAAILLRVYLITVISYLLDIPGLKLLGGVALLLIGIKLIAHEDSGETIKIDDKSVPNFARQDLELWSAVVLVVIADLVMSLDNVVALAAAAKGSMFFLILGLLFSVPLLMYGSVVLGAMIKRFPWLITAGGGLLGWIAGDIASSDVLVADWLNNDAPALGLALPLLTTIFVIVESKIIDQELRIRPRQNREEGGLWLSNLASVLGGSRGSRRHKPANLPSSTSQPAYLPMDSRAALEAGVLILLVDDNPRDQMAVRRQLEELGFAVETANDGSQALEKWRERGYGLIITDCAMPQMDGYALAKAILAGQQDGDRIAPIIGLVGYVSGKSATDRCIEAGMRDVLSKPVDPISLEKAVLTLLPAAAALRRCSAGALEDR